jgi:hypothetical protein
MDPFDITGSAPQSLKILSSHFFKSVQKNTCNKNSKTVSFFEVMQFITEDRSQHFDTIDDFDTIDAQLPRSEIIFYLLPILYFFRKIFQIFPADLQIKIQETMENVIGIDDCIKKLWLENFTPSHQYRQANGETICCMTISGNKMITGLDNGSLVVFDILQKKDAYVIYKAHCTKTTALAANDQFIVSAGDNDNTPSEILYSILDYRPFYTICVWDKKTGAKIKSRSVFAMIQALAVRNNMVVFAKNTEDGSSELVMYNALTGNPVAKKIHLKQEASSIVITENNNIIAGTTNGMIYLFDDVLTNHSSEKDNQTSLKYKMILNAADGVISMHINNNLLAYIGQTYSTGIFDLTTHTWTHHNDRSKFALWYKFSIFGNHGMFFTGSKSIKIINANGEFQKIKLNLDERNRVKFVGCTDQQLIFTDTIDNIHLWQTTFNFKEVQSRPPVEKIIAIFFLDKP